MLPKQNRVQNSIYSISFQSNFILIFRIFYSIQMLNKFIHFFITSLQIYLRGSIALADDTFPSLSTSRY